MNGTTAIGRSEHLTFKGNLKHTRYGWLRLTPAYSVHFVSELLSRFECADAAVLDPFCGTGTTALVCAERGIYCDTTDVNPFLIWLTRAKARPYGGSCLDTVRHASKVVASAIRAANDDHA